MPQTPESKLDLIPPVGQVSTEPDGKTLQEKEDLSGQSDHAKRMAHLEVEDRAGEVRNRAAYTRRLFCLMVVWIVAVLLIIVASGMRTPTNPPVTGVVWPWWAWLVVVVMLFSIAVGVWLPRLLTDPAKPQTHSPESFQAGWRRLFGPGPLKWIIVTGLAVILVVASSLITIWQVSTSDASQSTGWSFMDWVVSFELSDAVLLGLIGGTTANVIGLFLVVTRYLFPRRGA